MIYYVNTEIVVDDNELTFNEAYPVVLNSQPNGVYNSAEGSYYYRFSFTLAEGENVLQPGGNIATSFPELIGTKIYAFVLCQRGTDFFTVSQVLDSFGVCYYCYLKESSESLLGSYIRLTQSDIPAGIKNPFTKGFVSVGGDDIYFLYNLGSVVTSESTSFTSLFDINIGGYNLLSLLFSSGFMIYAGWVVIKFAVPT